MHESLHLDKGDGIQTGASSTQTDHGVYDREFGMALTIEELQLRMSIIRKQRFIILFSFVGHVREAVGGRTKLFFLQITMLRRINGGFLFVPDTLRGR